MKRHKIDPLLDDFIKQLGQKLSQACPTYKAVQYTGVKGEVIMNTKNRADLYPHLEGKHLESGALYNVPMVVEVPCNHYKRMKKAYQKNGEEGFLAYVSQFELKDKSKFKKLTNKLFKRG